MSILPKRGTVPLVALRKGDEVIYYTGKTKISKDLYEKLQSCEKYENLRKAGFDGEEIVQLGQLCEEAIDEVVPVAMRQGKERALRYIQEQNMKKMPAKKKAKKSVSKASVKCGTDKNGRRYYFVDGKRATREAYVAAGGRCSASPPKKKRAAKK